MPRKGQKKCKNIFFCLKQIFYRSCTPNTCIKQFTRNPLNFYSLKVNQFHGDSVKNKSARTKQLHPDFLGLKYI